MSEDKRGWAADESAAAGRFDRATVPTRWIVICGVVVIAVGLVTAALLLMPAVPGREAMFFNTSVAESADPPHLSVWWGEIPEDVRQVSSSPRRETPSNIHPHDYTGPDACKKCHRENYDSWSRHPHRWMNALAKPSTVRGNFSNETISYLNGEATFYQEKGEYRMRLVREETRTFTVHQTIGSRFFQYYVGKQVSGSGAADANQLDHVLPFGYWLEPGEWVPVVHIFDEHPDGVRMDPFDADDYSKEIAIYAESCDICHTTYPLGDLLCKAPKRIAREVPVSLHWSATGYLGAERPAWSPSRFVALTDEKITSLRITLDSWQAPDLAVTLGVSCEACHLGSRAHVANPKEKPGFFPHSPHLRAESNAIDFGRTHDNVNWTCGRCHTGDRTHFAGGMSTWNSTEYADAMRGSCYSELKCIDCHNPHQAIGRTWPLRPDQDDALCIRCHQQYDPLDARTAHTHHPAGSAGSRCLNCHMPRVNEGLQDVVRTHMIYSPTEPRMIHSSHPNACNQCHADQPIDWTIEKLGQWYGATYDSELLDHNYPSRTRPAALGWLQSENHSVRLVAADTLTRTSSTWALDELIGALDDPYLLNRQFARIGIEAMLDVKLEDYGYRFYMTPAERRQPILDLRKTLVDSATNDPGGPQESLPSSDPPSATEKAD